MLKYFLKFHSYAHGLKKISVQVTCQQSLARIVNDLPNGLLIKSLYGSKDRIQHFSARKFNELFQLSEICLQIEASRILSPRLCETL